MWGLGTSSQKEAAIDQGKEMPCRNGVGFGILGLGGRLQGSWKGSTAR